MTPCHLPEVNLESYTVIQSPAGLAGPLFLPASSIQPSPLCSLSQGADLYQLPQPATRPSATSWVRSKSAPAGGRRNGREKGQDVYSLGSLLCGRCPESTAPPSSFCLPSSAPSCLRVCFRFLGCHNTSSYAEWLKTTEMCLTVLEPRSLKWRCRQGHDLPDTSKERYFLVPLGLPVFAGHPRCSLVRRYHSTLSLPSSTWCSSCVSSPFIVRMTVILDEGLPSMTSSWLGSNCKDSLSK